MSDLSHARGDDPAGGDRRDGSEPGPRSAVDDPAELVRVGTMLARLNGQLSEMDLDDSAVDRLRALHESTLSAPRDNLDEEPVDELRTFVPALGDGDRFESEVRFAHLQHVSWLELFQDLQMSAAGQQLRNQLAQASQARDRPQGSGNHL